MSGPRTAGVHHVGLAVPDLDAATQFFHVALGWKVVGRDPNYPATFVSDGSATLTLWRLTDPDRAIAFDRRSNVGLHHLALAVPSEAALLELYDIVRAHPGVTTEFAPEPSRPGSKTIHFICAMPGGARIEFATSAA
jgi:catechol 2,3-dioxygenase-like lactoylglutathione lyase family enzyme